VNLTSAATSVVCLTLKVIRVIFRYQVKKNTATVAQFGISGGTLNSH
jgi:hypothetical protein